MIFHKILLIYRNFIRNKGTTFINIAGLSTGIASAILIYLWVADEMNVDKFHDKNSQLYQVFSNHQYTSGILTEKATTGMLEQTLSQEMPEIENVACFVNYSDNILLSAGDKNIKAGGKFGSKQYFQIFSFPLLQGNPGDVLSNKDAIVLSLKLALNLFGTTENLIGKSVKIEHDEEYIVTGIFKDLPSNSSQQFDFMLSFEKLKLKYPDSFSAWGNTGPRTFIVLKKNTDLAQFRNKLKDFVKRKSDNSNTTLIIQPYSETYLYNNYENGALHSGRIMYVRLFSIIALFILAIACINFMNLSTAKASKRTKEVGIKKALGSSRKALIVQFMEESMLMTIISLGFAILIVEFLLPEFNNLTQKNLSLNFDNSHIFTIALITIFTGLIAGSYPALYISGFEPIKILKGQLQNSNRETLTRKGLVIFQFTISVILIILVLVVYRQIVFIQSQNPGYIKENLIYFAADGNIAHHKEAFISRIVNIPGIVSATSSDHTMTGHEHTTGLTWQGRNNKDDISFEFAYTGYGVTETFGMQMAEGRSFSKEFGDESSKIILNETAIKAMGIDDPIGKVVTQWGKKKEIIGIVRDFHFESFHDRVKPMFFDFDTAQTSMIFVRLKAGSGKRAIDQLTELYNESNPGFIFDYKFLDMDYQALYVSENRVAVLSRYFAGIAILISCLGLFGLASFNAERRSKEIGIRKIMGSGETGIVLLLSNEYTALVSMAVLIAIPLAYYIALKWLNNFAYRTELSWWIFLAAGSMAFAIALVTVSWQSWRAATRNPVEALRYE